MSSVPSPCPHKGQESYMARKGISASNYMWSPKLYVSIWVQECERQSSSFLGNFFSLHCIHWGRKKWHSAVPTCWAGHLANLSLHLGFSWKPLNLWSKNSSYVGRVSYFSCYLRFSRRTFSDDIFWCHEGFPVVFIMNLLHWFISQKCSEWFLSEWICCQTLSVGNLPSTCCRCPSETALRKFTGQKINDNQKIIVQVCQDQIKRSSLSKYSH